MECPFCTATLPDDDAFCEECGKPVNAPVAVAPPEACPNCGAPESEIADDGFCDRCGHRARRPASDHVEIVISPDFAGVSDRGLKHQRNEDRFAMRQAGDGFVLVVCDGVSSSTESELASSAVSEHVAQSLEKSLLRHSASSPERTVRVAIEEARAALTAATMDKSDPPSTTVVAAVVNGSDATIGWVGDSRAYWIDSEVKPLTVDHSWMNEVVMSGEMNAETAAQAPQAHGITRWLGADAGENARPDVVRFKITGPGVLLLCTDGLWNYAEDQTVLREMLGPGPNLEEARKLINYANEKGGHDNITAILLRMP